MVGMPLCVSIGLALCQSNVVSDEDITEQKHYSKVDESHINEMIENSLAPLYSREIPDLEVLEYVQGYYEYKEQEEAKNRALEEKQSALVEYDKVNYRQTVYTVAEGETELGSGLYYGHPDIEVIDNVMHYNDSEYGWLPIVAINMNEVMSSGQNEQGIWNIYGSVIELKQGTYQWNAIVLDACGACRYSNKVDLWTYNLDSNLDVTNIDWRYVRHGYSNKENKYID